MQAARWPPLMGLSIRLPISLASTVMNRSRSGDLADKSPPPLEDAACASFDLAIDATTAAAAVKRAFLTGLLSASRMRRPTRSMNFNPFIPSTLTSTSFPACDASVRHDLARRCCTSE